MTVKLQTRILDLLSVVFCLGVLAVLITKPPGNHSHAVARESACVDREEIHRLAEEALAAARVRAEDCGNCPEKAVIFQALSIISQKTLPEEEEKHDHETHSTAPTESIQAASVSYWAESTLIFSCISTVLALFWWVSF